MKVNSIIAAHRPPHSLSYEKMANLAILEQVTVKVEGKEHENGPPPD